MTFVASMATNPAHSIHSGEILPPDEMTISYDIRMLGAVFSRDVLRELGATRFRTDKIIANVILLASNERGDLSAPNVVERAILKLAEEPGGRDKLLSQYIDDNCLDALQNQDAAGFMEARAQLILARARDLSGAAET